MTPATRIVPINTESNCLPTETGSQSAGQLPVSGAQAAHEYERQQQTQAQTAPSNAAFSPGQR
jgi:hypothetical protein